MAQVLRTKEHAHAEDMHRLRIILSLLQDDYILRDDRRLVCVNWSCPVLYWYYIVYNCIVLYSIIFYCFVIYWIVLYWVCIELHCIVLGRFCIGRQAAAVGCWDKWLRLLSGGISQKLYGVGPVDNRPSNKYLRPFVKI